MFVLCMMWTEKVGTEDKIGMCLEVGNGLDVRWTQGPWLVYKTCIMAQVRVGYTWGIGRICGGEAQANLSG